jgi:hypothetical protein
MAIKTWFFFLQTYIAVRILLMQNNIQSFLPQNSASVYILTKEHSLENQSGRVRCTQGPGLYLWSVWWWVLLQVPGCPCYRVSADPCLRSSQIVLQQWGAQLQSLSMVEEQKPKHRWPYPLSQEITVESWQGFVFQPLKSNEESLDRLARKGSWVMVRPP